MLKFSTQPGAAEAEGLEAGTTPADCQISLQPSHCLHGGAFARNWPALVPFHK